MYEFLGPLLLGFGLDWASAFTTAFSRRWGPSRGRLATFVLRNLLGIPLWVVGIALAVHAPSPRLFAATTWPAILGWLLLLAGAGVQLWAIAAIRVQAARPSVDDALVARGIYARIRHPIYAGALLEFAGMVLVQPRQTVALAAVIAWVWAFVQARLEEVDLLQRMPAYREYMNRVPRFLPKVGVRS